MVDEYVVENLISRIGFDTFMILDTFDRSYNPAKALVINSIKEREYFNAFESTLKNLLEKKSLEDFS